MRNLTTQNQNFFHESGPHNRAYFRRLEHTKAGKQVDALTGLTALQMAGRRVIGDTYSIGRNEAKRVKTQLRKVA